MTKSKTFGTWLKTHTERNDDLGFLAGTFYSFKRVQDFREEDGHAQNCRFHFKDIKKPSQLYWMIKTYAFFSPYEKYERIARLAAKQYSRYRRDLSVQFEMFDPYTDDQLRKAVREIGA